MRCLGMGIFEFHWLAWRIWFFPHLFYHLYIARVNEEDIVAVDRPHMVIWIRRLIITERNLIGLASKAIKKRDLICIVSDCSVPVILCRRHDEEADEE